MFKTPLLFRRPLRFFFWMLVGSLAGVDALAQTLPATLTLTNVTILGQPRTLTLYKRPVRSPNFTYLTWSVAVGYETNAAPPVRTYRGTVVGATNTIVCAVIKPGGLLTADGFDYEQGKSYTWQIKNVNVASQLPAGAYAPALGEAEGESSSQLPTTFEQAESDRPCGHPDCQPQSELGSEPASAQGPLLGALPPSTYMPPSGGMQVMDLGIDITHFRYVYYGSSADLAFAEIEHTVNIYDLIMARDAVISIQASVVVLRQDIFYVPTGMGDQLNKMITEWKKAPLINLPWDQVYSFQTEQGLFGAGGYAWGNNIGKDESPACVEALYHEAGHNWDVGHLTYGRDTMGGNRPNHGPFSIDRLLRKRSESITEGDLTPYPGTYPDPLPPYTHVDCASTLTNTPVNINVLTNDWDGNGNALTVIAFSTNTTKGGTVTHLGNGVLRYTPATGYVGKDLFAYTIRDSTGLKTRELVHVEVVNRDLEARYAFDDASGKVATDSAGFGHPGKLQGANEFSVHAEPGVSGTALRVEGGGIICDNSPLMPADAPVQADYNYWPFDSDTMSRGNFFDPMEESCTMAFWFKAYDTTATRSLLKKEWHNEQKVGFNVTMSGGGITATVREFNGLSSTKTLNWSTALAAGRWYHVVLQFDRAANQARLFVDGVQRSTGTLDAGRFIFQGRQPLLLGADASGQVAFDEFRYYTKTLSTADIQALYAIGHIAASGPAPADEERDVALQPALSWVAGRTNYQHDLFLGTNLAAVTAATTNSAEYVGRRTVASYLPGAALQPNTQYYWRVDEILGGTNVAHGDIWTFKTAIDAIHGGLRIQYTLDTRDTIGTVTYDRAGPPFQDGLLVNAPTVIAGQVADALDFNGTSHYVDVPTLNQTLNSATLLAWVRRNGAQVNYSAIIFHRNSGGGTSGMNISTGNRLGYHWNDAANTYNYASGPVLPDGQWALAAVVVETNRAIFYLGTTDGLLTVTTNGVAHGLCTFNGNWRVASDSSSSTRYFKGGIDEPAIWTRALTRAEIGQILTNGMAGGGIDGPPPSPQPGTFTWTGNADNNWSTPANWVAGTVPGIADTAIFDESSARNLNTDLGLAQSVSGLLITGKLRGVGIGSVAGNALTLGGGGLKLSNSFTSLTLSAPVSLGAIQTWSVSEFASLTINSNLANGGRTLTLDAGGPATVAGVISGAGGLVKRGEADLTISGGMQALTGGLVVSNGTLKALGGGWAQSLFANVIPRTITIHPGARLETTTHSLGGLGGSFYQPVLTLNDGATWQLNAEQYLSGNNLILKGAAITIQANDLRIQGGTVNINSSSLPTTFSGAGYITLYGTTTFSVADGPLATDATISVRVASSGVQGLTKSGSGTLGIAEVAAYTGPTTVSSGKLSLQAGRDTLPQDMAVSVSAGAILALNNNDQTLSSLSGSGSVQLGYGALTLSMTSTQTYSGVISGSPAGAPPPSGNTEEAPNPGGLTKTGVGKLTLTGINTFSGDTLIQSGILALSGSGGLASSSNLVVGSGAILDVTAKSGGLGLGAGQTLSGPGTVLGPLTVNNLSTLAPGESVGQLATGPQTWSGNGRYRWEISHAMIPGSWDALAVNGIITVTATAGNPFVIELLPLSSPLPGFTETSGRTWTLATATGISGFAADKFRVDAAGLGQLPSGATFGVEQQGNSIMLRYTPASPGVPPVILPGPVLSGAQIQFQFTGTVGARYLVEHTPALPATGPWQLVTNIASLPASPFTVSAPATNSAGFYRVGLAP